MNRLREAGLRITPQRRAVWSVFEGRSEGHFTAEEVFEQAQSELPELSRATVYNTLGALVEAGLLRAVENRNALLYDPNPDPTHHHFSCRRCERLYDVHVEGIEDLTVADERDFAVEQKVVLLAGLCPRCAPLR